MSARAAMALSNAARANRSRPSVHVKVAQLFVIPRRRIVSNHSLEFANPLTTRKHLEGLAEQSKVRKCLDEDIYQRAERSEKEDDENPIHVRPPPDEVDDCESLEQQAPWE